jgi:hypothetical protein
MKAASNSVLHQPRTRSLRRGRSAPLDLHAVLLGTPTLVVAAISALVVTSRSIGRDSGVFLYSGQTILRGGSPYVDAWDHKGPLLYLFNAIGARLTGGDILGVGLLESSLLIVGTATFTAVWAKAGGALVGALAGLTVGLSYFQVFEGGNFSETWSFPFALVAYALVATGFLQPAEHHAARLPGVALGVAGAVAALTRPSNGIGLFAVAIWFCFAWPHSDSTRLTRAAWVAGSGLFVMLPVLIYVASSGAWSAMWEQFIRYNFAYSGSSSSAVRLIATVSVFRMSLSAPVALLALVMAMTLLVTKRREVNVLTSPTVTSVGLLLTTALALDFAGANLSGRGFPHYVVTVLPAIGSIAALLVVAAVSAGPLTTVAQSSARSLAFVVVVALILTSLGLLRGTFSMVESTMRTGLTNPRSTLSIITAEIQRRTSPQDPVYVWGAETVFLAAAQRVSSSSLTYYYPVTRQIRDVDAAGRQLAADLRERPPALVLRAQGAECAFDAPCNIAALREAHAFVAANYELDGPPIDGFEFWVPR